MEETDKYMVLKNGEGFTLLKITNHKTRRIYKIYKNNPPLGVKLFKAYLDKNPRDTITRNK